MAACVAEMESVIYRVAIAMVDATPNANSLSAPPWSGSNVLLPWLCAQLLALSLRTQNAKSASVSCMSFAEDV